MPRAVAAPHALVVGISSKRIAIVSIIPVPIRITASLLGVPGTCCVISVKSSTDSAAPPNLNGSVIPKIAMTTSSGR